MGDSAPDFTDDERSDTSAASTPKASSVAASKADAPAVVNIKQLTAQQTLLPKLKVKRDLSWTRILPVGTVNEMNEDLREPLLFCDVVKRADADKHAQGLIGVSNHFNGPSIKDCPLSDLARKPGHVPVLNIFHSDSHRPRYGSDDDGLDLEDLADGARKKGVEKKISRRRTQMYESMKMVKGEFTFPHRTYRPKAQVAYRVPPGQVPQAVVIERLHRLYKKTDINVVCQSLGIEISDLIPPPNYGETNERFYQESMWRNRTRISGIDKRDFIINGGKAIHEDGVDFYAQSTTSSSEYSSSLEVEGEDEEVQAPAEDSFIKSKPPFGPQFPLDDFDNEEFDIRPGQEWIGLGWDNKAYKMYPIPGKAFLPMPLPSTRAPVAALSEVTNVNLLKRTEALEKFRKWLLKERYKRQMILTGIKYSPSMAHPNENEMTILARTATTVQALFQEGTGSTSGTVSVRDPRDITMTAVTSYGSISRMYSDEMDGESDDQTPDESYVSFHYDQGSDDLLTQFQKSDNSAKTPTDSRKDSAPLEVKRSESILSDIFSDPNSLTALAIPEAATQGLRQLTFEDDKDGQEMSEEEIYVLHDARNIVTGSQRFHPESPDIDPYEDGYSEFVFDYDKMKKVHNYDWKWVEVAIFAYDSDRRKYFVRSIFPPFIYAWVNKLYLLMDGEDPSKHGKRIKDAVERRIEIEGLMRYSLYVDCLPTDRAAKLPDGLLEKIVKKTLSTPRLVYSERLFDKIKKEVNLEYKRSHMRMLFDHIIEKHASLYKPWVHTPEYYEQKSECNDDWKAKSQRYEECRTNNFAFKCTRLLRESVLYKTEPYRALGEIVGACLKARDIPFLLALQKEPLSIDQYEKRQIEQIFSVQEYLKQEWMKSILDSIRTHLGAIPRSWYNIEEDRWDVFNMSKSSKFLTLVRFMMQDTLRYMVEDSLNTFVAELELLTVDCAGITRNYKWKNNLLVSDFPTPVGMYPIFLLDLTIDKDGPKYNQLLSRFPKTLTQIFFNCIDSSSGIPDIVPQIMQGLLFGTTRTLQSVEKAEVTISALKVSLNKFLRRGLTPVDIYAQKFKYYLPVWNLDQATFLKDWESNDHTTKEIRLTVEFHMRHMEEIESELPSTIDIGAFRINVDVVKQALLKKKKALFTSILDSFAARLRNIILQIRSDYQDIERKLSNRSDDIEEVMEMKVYCTGVEGVILRKGEQIERVMKDYEIFEKFKYPVPAEDFESKWAAAMGTTKMLRIAMEAVTWLDDDYDRLLKVQQSDLTALSDQVDSTTLAVAGLVAYVELEKANEVQQEVKKIWKQVKDLQETSALLNKRQKIFGLPPAQNEALIRLGKDIEPFKSLWFTAADWIKLQDVIFQGTLDKVDVSTVTKLITEGGRTIRRCVKYFAGAEAIQHIAEEVRHQIQEFKPLVPLIRTFKNPGLRQRHLEAISEICGFNIVAKGNQSFKKLLDQGIGNYIDEIEVINDRATHELEIERSMDKMQREINSYKLTVFKDEAGFQTVVYPEGVQEVIVEYIKDTDKILDSEFKAPFEERIALWEKKIRLAKDNLELWMVNQSDWIELQESFKIPDVENKLPAEFKLYTKMERIWRRVMRLVRDTPDVLDIGSDTTLRASLQQFSTLVYRVRKGLEEHMKPSNSDSDDDSPPPQTMSTT